MNFSRVPTLTSLFLALLLGAAPWRVCAHGDHSGIWVPGLHAHGTAPGAPSHRASTRRSGCSQACGHHHARGAHRCGTHAAGSEGRRAHLAQHLPAGSTPAGQPPSDHDGCHCDDQPLAKCLRAVPVQVAAPQVTGERDLALHVPASARAAGVAPLRREAWRVACESDPIVLLR